MTRRLLTLILAFTLSFAPFTGAADKPEVPLPNNGAVHRFTKAKAMAPLQIVTAGEAAHYLVKLSPWQGGKPVLTVFVRAGKSVDLEVPLGSYRIKYAAGEEWQGDQALFGEATEFYEADKRFDFVRTKHGIRGYTIELILQAGGNLATRKLSKGDW